MPDLIYEKFDHYAVFTMNRPERLNALGGNMGPELNEALDDFTADPEMRVGIMTGAGRAFSAGMDLKQRAESDARAGDGPRRAPARAGAAAGAMQLSRNPKPFIAAINGICIAGGLERALDCDIRICSTNAVFGLFEVKRGILAGYAIHHLMRMIPSGEAMYLLLTGDQVGPEYAHRWGLVHDVVEPEQLMARAIEIARMIAANAPLSVEGTKAMAQYWRQLNIDESYRMGQWVSRAVLNSQDAREGPRAFAEKRPPVWTGR